MPPLPNDKVSTWYWPSGILYARGFGYGKMAEILGKSIHTPHNYVEKLKEQLEGKVKIEEGLNKKDKEAAWRKGILQYLMSNLEEIKAELRKLEDRVLIPEEVWSCLDNIFSVEEQGVRLSDLPYVEDAYHLHEIVSRQFFVFSLLQVLRELVDQAPNPSRILDYGTTIIHDTWKSSGPASEQTKLTLALLIETRAEHWAPSRSLVRSLQSLCNTSLDERDPTKAVLIETVSFGLTKKGDPTLHRRALRAALSTPSWTDVILQSEVNYYGSERSRLSAYNRHFNDPHYVGLLQVNDVSRLLNLAETTSGSYHVSVIQLLNKHLVVLQNQGEHDLARAVRKQLE